MGTGTEAEVELNDLDGTSKDDAGNKKPRG
jgi:hypothetical protein